ncbi:hypothetical protein BU17DRAFT_60336 [Hysterangium stoloniferum]|nr:hypothetical protein BU17DRAFT_60336 [Hysterangium stoloniferum]
MLHKYLGWHALSATAWTVWTRNFETVKLKWKHLTFGCVTEDEFRIPHWKLSLVERKNWQSKLYNEVDLRGAGIDVTLPHLSTHCFRWGGSQYRFMLAPVRKCWTLATICWWGDGQRENIEVNMSFLGEHKDIRPVSLLEMKELWSSMERSMGKTIKAGFSHSTSDAAASHRHGEHAGIQSNNNTTNTTNVMPIPLPLSSLLASPPPGLSIPATRIGIPRHERWLTFVHDWENIDESQGLHKPLKDWPTEWKTHLAFAMSYRARKLIAEEYILKKWPMAVNGTTELTLALRDALKEEGISKPRRRQYGTPKERERKCKNGAEVNTGGKRSEGTNSVSTFTRANPMNTLSHYLD